MGRQSSIKSRYAAIGVNSVAAVLAATEAAGHRARRNMLRRMPVDRPLHQLPRQIRIEYKSGLRKAVEVGSNTQEWVEDQMAKIAGRSTVARCFIEWAPLPEAAKPARRRLFQ